MPLSLLVLTTFALLFTLGACIVSKSSSIGYETHSYNDLRLWPGMFQKGAQWIKIDINFQLGDFCASQQAHLDPNWKPGQPCFVLNHNEPVKNRLYNTTYNLLQLFQNPPSWFGENHDKLYIALCFKLSTVKHICNSTNGLSWIKSASDFIHSATHIVNQNPRLNIEFILDGASVPNVQLHPCLANKFGNLVATWTNDVPWGAFTSNDPKYDYNRFQIMNVMESPIDPPFLLNTLAHLNYGKFLNSSYPWLFWEPSDEKSISSVCRAYLEHPLHSSFRFAINIDILQFSLYSGEYSGKSSHIGANGLVSSLQKPQISVDSNNIGFLFGFAGNSPVLYSSSWPFQDWKNTFSSFDCQDGCTIDSGVVSSLSWITDLNPTNNNSFVKTTTTLTRYSNPKEILKFSFNHSWESLVDFSFAFNTLCILANNDLSGLLVCNSSLVHKFDSSFHTGNLLITPTSIYAAVEHDYHIYITIFSPDGILKKNLSFLEFIGSSPQWSYSSVSTLVGFVAQDGYCTNCQTFNKQAFPATCDQTQTPVKGVLSYTFGYENDWLNLKPLSLSKNPTCQPGLISGMYDSGFQPSLSFYHKNGNDYFALAHKGLGSFSSPQLETCGIALSQSGLVSGWSPVVSK